jgi:hypothetical protein
MNWIIKIAKDYEGNNIWQALYYKGTRIIENFKLDKNTLAETFSIPSSEIIKEVEMAENDTTNLPHLFPYYEDFSYLEEDLMPIYPGQTIWIPDIKGVISGGWAVVEDVWHDLESCSATYKNVLLSEDTPEYLQYFVSCENIQTLFSWDLLEKIQLDLKSRYGYEQKAKNIS